MLTLCSKTHVAGLRGRDIIDFFLHCDDATYQRWWPGTHLHFRTIERHANDAGNVVYFDELVGRRRLKLHGVVTEIVPGKRLVWQLGATVRLPGRLILELDDDSAGVHVTHTLEAGFAGAGRVLDPVLRLYLDREFEREMDAHMHTEFEKLGELMRAAPSPAA